MKHNQIIFTPYVELLSSLWYTMLYYDDIQWHNKDKEYYVSFKNTYDITILHYILGEGNLDKTINNSR